MPIKPNYFSSTDVIRCVEIISGFSADAARSTAVNSGWLLADDNVALL